MSIYGLDSDCYSAKMNKTYLVSQPTDFSEVINDILESSNFKDTPLIITLEGDLGAGKTTFTQELGKKLGVSEPVTSPTFTIMKQYPLSGGIADSLIHIDAYRIESEEEVAPLHFESLFVKPRTIICIEWPSHIESIIPDTAIKVSISIKEKEERLVEIIRP